MDNYAEALLHAKRNFFIIGLTGYTGAGCSTTKNILKSSNKPSLPSHTTVEKYIDIKRYNKLDTIWDTVKWRKCTGIDVSKVIFMFAINRALSTKFTTGPLATLRKICLPSKDQLKGIKYLYKDSVNLRNKRIAKQLLGSYKKSIRLYGRFKSKCEYNLSDFIEEMQNFGDQIREYGVVKPPSSKKKEPSSIFVLPEAIRRIIRAYRTIEDSSYFVIDAFRNPYEIEYFKRRYNEFYLIAIQRKRKEIRNALRDLDPEFLNRLEKRESGEKVERRKDNISKWVVSQNIKECIQKADIYIENIFDKSNLRPHLKYHIVKIISLIYNPGCINPNIDERNMQIAASARRNSGCISRNVGAVVVKDNVVLGVGWNDPPRNQTPCSLRTVSELLNGPDDKVFSRYERDKKFIDHIAKKENKKASFCFREEYSEITKNNEREFTRAVHAEENALMLAIEHGREAVKDAILYTTDKTCTLCAKKAYQLSIKKVVFVSEYPGIAIEQTLFCGEHKVEIKRFEGIIGASFFKLFDSIMPEKDMLKLI